MTQEEYATMLANQAQGPMYTDQFEEEEDDGMSGFTSRGTGTGNGGGGNPYAMSNDQ